MADLPLVQSTNDQSNVSTTDGNQASPTTPLSVQNQPPIQATQPVNPAWNNNAWGGWGANDASANDAWGGWGANPAPIQQPQAAKKLTPEERVTMIEKIYFEILYRKPDTRDINYYKYSTLGEDEIRKQLIQGKEHKELVEHGREYKNLNDRTNSSETKVRILEGQIKDQIEEFKKLTDLLKEKNRYIEQLRIELKNPLNLPRQAMNAFNSQNVPESKGNTNYKTDSASQSSKKDLEPNLFEKIINAFGG